MEAQLESELGIRWILSEIKEYRRTQMKVIFIKEKLEEDCYLDIQVAWNNETINDLKPVLVSLLTKQKG